MLISPFFTLKYTFFHITVHLISCYTVLENMHNYTFSPPSPPPSHHLLSTFASTFSPPSFHLHLHLLSIFTSTVGCSHLWSSSGTHATCGHRPPFVPLVVITKVCCLWSLSAICATHGCPPLVVIHHSWSSTACATCGRPPLMVTCPPTLLLFKLLCVCGCVRTRTCV